MKIVWKKYPLLTFFTFLLFVATAQKSIALHSSKTIIVKTAFDSGFLSAEWKQALVTRMSRQKIDSFAAILRSLTPEEIEWKQLIFSKAVHWNAFRDSLAIPFNDLYLADTVFVLIGFLGQDDGFTWKYNTVCLDITALNRVYGNAETTENNDRIDRLFAHEYTHLLHKTWAAKYKYQPVSFKDEILWECWYEGMGMYRSLTQKWKPVNGILPAETKQALEELYPVFAEKTRMIETHTLLTEDEKVNLQKGLSRGPVNKKWGAFPVAIWLLMEADWKDKNLVSWMSKGPGAVLLLAKKYLPADLKDQPGF